MDYDIAQARGDALYEFHAAWERLMSGDIPDSGEPLRLPGLPYAG